MAITESNDALLALADQYGVETTYFDIWGASKTASNDALVGALRSLGASIERGDDVSDAHRVRTLTLWSRRIEPVLVAWDGALKPIIIRIPGGLEHSACECTLQTESGEVRTWTVRLDELNTKQSADVEGVAFLTKELVGIDRLPLGYHRFSIEIGAQREEALIISAPTRAWTFAADAQKERVWGVFMPLHALRSRASRWGGNLSDLGELMSWTADLGGSLVGTLPLLASFLDVPFDPSPYSPASRLFWNELFLDLDQVQGMARSVAAQELRAAIAAVSPSTSNRVDYRSWAGHQRGVLEALSDAFFAQPGERDPNFQAFLNQQPRVGDYARFRAAQEQHKSGWIVWPDEQRDGVINESDIDPRRARYHAFVQWQLDQQLSTLAVRAKDAGAQLYLDFPLGVHADSYDTWREQASFARGIAVGAPPDMFFTAGQNWGFPPMHPEAIRTRGYGYIIEAIRNHMRFAGALRIDHVMGLLRLYWIPHGMGAQNGVYVRYQADELFAILALESRRANCLIVGEDLGTVPDVVRSAMSEHDFLRMYVAQFEMTPDPENALNPVPTAAMASLNTHDTVLFGGFWEGLDIDVMRTLELIDDADREGRHAEREELLQSLCAYLLKDQESAPLASSALGGILRHLAAGPAQVLMVTLEDLWLEREPQNVPGTGDDWENWRRKAAFSIQEFRTNPDVLETLREIDRLRQTGTHAS
ncbi:MAG: 4-alpha-glucanotransferase [Chloroflexota bacterium]